MRRPGTKVYRAFRELGRFDDASCQRFIKASNRYGWPSNAGYTAVMCLAAAVVFVGVTFARWRGAAWLSELPKTANPARKSVDPPDVVINTLRDPFW